jgi:hypothetical protein
MDRQRPVRSLARKRSHRWVYKGVGVLGRHATIPEAQVPNMHHGRQRPRGSSRRPAVYTGMRGNAGADVFRLALIPDPLAAIGAAAAHAV